MPDTPDVDALILDVDGTLVDTNYHHALAWSRAFGSAGVDVDVWRIHRKIGMGGDQLVPAVGGDQVEQDAGEAIRSAWREEYDALIGEVRVFEHAHALLTALRRHPAKVVLASSSPQEHVDHYLDLLAARDLVDAWTTADDAEQSKPAPDLVGIAMRKVGASTALMVGDSPWDVVAARRAGIDTWTLLTGGFADSELTAAGADAVYESLVELASDLGTPLGSPTPSSAS